jgi:hypothetical protein
VPDASEGQLEGEIVTDISAGGEPGGKRQLRVYKHGGDFIIEIPSEAKVTFGYFNPAAPRAGRDDYDMRGNNVARQTALRIYESNSEKSNQLACFLGVGGFRDLRISLTQLKQRVTIETNFEDDGMGQTRFHEEAQRALLQANEDEVGF